MAEQDHILTVHNMCTLEPRPSSSWPIANCSADGFGDRIVITCVTQNAVIDVRGRSNISAATMPCEYLDNQFYHGNGASANTVQDVRLRCARAAQPIATADDVQAIPITGGVLIADLLKDPATKAVLRRLLSDHVKSGRMIYMGGLTLAQYGVFAPDVTPAKLAELEDALAKVPRVRAR